VPKVWTDTVEEHRRAVRDAALDATAVLVADHGLRSVTMGQIAEATGISRATLYRYFPDADAILVAWHERQVNRHLAHLTAVRDAHAVATERLAAVLDAYATILHEHHSTEGAAALHRGEHVARAQDSLACFVADLISDAAVAGTVRSDITAAELTSFTLNALAAARTARSRAAARRLAVLVLAGLRP
jgi:AcrR family transcriptional regulator